MNILGTVAITILALLQLFYCEDTLESLIKDVFEAPTAGGEKKPTDQKTNSQQMKKINKGDCRCVPYFLCVNNTYVTDGSGLIDARARRSVQDDEDSQCATYLDVCCKDTDLKSNKIKPHFSCGTRNSDFNNWYFGTKQQTLFGEIPWLVAVLSREINNENQERYVYQCGGTLIHPRMVLTAAHCVTKYDQKQYSIRAGEWNTQTNSERYQHRDVNVQKVIIHPYFYKIALYYDVALLFLAEHVEIEEHIDVGCLPRQDLITEQDVSGCFLTGWGKNRLGEEGRFQVIPKKIELPIVPRDQCEEALQQTHLGLEFHLHRTFLCAGGQKDKDACNGDGGSPFMCPIPDRDNKYYVAGIVSWGIGCGDKNVPGVYVNVAKFRNWIDQQMKSHRLSISTYNYNGID